MRTAWPEGLKTSFRLKWEILKMRTSISGGRSWKQFFLPKASSMKTKAASVYVGNFSSKVQLLSRSKEFFIVKNREHNIGPINIYWEPTMCKALFCSEAQRNRKFGTNCLHLPVSTFRKFSPSSVVPLLSPSWQAYTITGLRVLRFKGSCWSSTMLPR